MKVSGITFVKNGLKLGYPVLQSIQSIAPLCDEVIINIGFDQPECQSDDGTYELLTNSLKGEKFKFLKSYWDPEVSSQGLILSQQTNIALNETTGDIIQYIQADEAIHEDDFEIIKKEYKNLLDRDDIHGLIFNYLHLYGNTNVYRHTRSVYRREVRAIKNHCQIESWKDAQGFRFKNHSKIKAKQIDARIFHYGWARLENVQNLKLESFNKLYHGKDFKSGGDFTYRKIWGLKKFEKTHPKVLQDWIKENTNEIDILSLPSSYRFGDWDLMVSDFVEQITGWRMGEYKNYIEVK